ncbi:AAA family ATPase [Sphingobacterium siyangense]|uniref:AAA family ATPase n=1 Tax=Sphingobacterium siyangense TaxID=459529 RepID=UPI002FDD1C98
MKIKKVEIQAFRAYDKVENSTFDFGINDGKYADFVSLYAPNGFGKTSFYDAVEYSYTNNIDRLLKNRNNKDVAKSEKNINKNDKQYILRNRFSDSSLESYVKLTTSADVFDKKIPTPRKNAADYRFDESETEREYFREVILSQDWISSFLKEDKPEERFVKFMEAFGDRDLNTYRKVLDELITKNNKLLKELMDSLKGIQLKLKFDADVEILSKINEKIDLLNELGHQFNAVDTHTSNKDILILTNAITEQKNILNHTNGRLKEVLSGLELLITGNERLSSFRDYKNNIQQHKELLEKLSVLDIIKTQFIDLQQNRELVASTQNRNRELDAEKKRKESILKVFPDYDKLIRQIAEKADSISELKIAKEKSSKELSDIDGTLIEDTAKIGTLGKQLSDVEETLKQLPEIVKTIAASQRGIAKISDDIKGHRDKLDKEVSKLDAVSLHIEELENSLLEIGAKNYPSQFESTFEKYGLSIQKILDVEKLLEENHKELESLNLQIEGQKSFQKDLELFVSKGLSMINEQKISSCPLCNHDYETYNSLAEAVSGNRLLSTRMTELLNRKTDIEQSYQELREDLQERIQQLTEIIKADISLDELSILEIRGNLLEIRNTINILEEKLEDETKYLSSERMRLQSKTGNEFETWAKETVISYNTELEKLKSAFQLLNEKNIKAKEQQQILINKLEAEESALKLLEGSGILVDIQNFFMENYPNQPIKVDNLVLDIKEIDDELQLNLSSISELSNAVKALELALKDYNEDNVLGEIAQADDRINRILAQMVIYKLNAGKYISSEIEKMDEKAFHDLIADLKKENEKKISDHDEELRQLQILSELKDNVLPYLEFEKNRRDEKSVKGSIDKKKRVSSVLGAELKKVNSHMEKQIKSFFYEDLINDLYKRIDPHPEYTKVKFIPDFKDAKPKLNVCVYGKDNIDDSVIPNLYFSQAQLNILSLCIFLAKALNAKDDDNNSIDCIFVDDPIQSMDSINILSTIDLLRSIVVNHKKQIILSTHDENFHNLLKKKIPQTLFQSKFMELETFGKVKPI